MTAGILLTLAVLSGCTTPGPTAAPPPRPAGGTPVPVPTSVQRIPGQPPVVHYGTVPDAVRGVPYEFHLYVHCGIRTADFAGRTWTVRPRSDPPPSSAEAGAAQYLVGAMTLVAPDRALFEWPGGRAEFEPARTPLPVCA